MDISNPHNLLVLPPAPAELRFGVRVTMPPGDPFRGLLGADWQREHWFASRDERDASMEEMGKRHAYNRSGDIPSIVLEAIER